MNRRPSPFHYLPLLAAGVFVAFYALRYNTGADHVNYLKDFETLKATGSFGRLDYEFGFKAITKIIAVTQCHFAFYFAFWGVLQFALLYYAFRHRKHLLPWLFLVLLLGPFCLNWLSFLRQWFIAIALLASLELIEKRRFWLYLLLVACFCLIHKSAWILFFLYWIPFFKANEWSWKVNVLILVVCTLLGVYPIWVKGLGVFSEFINWIGYGKYQYLFAPLVNDNEFALQSWGPRHIITWATCAIPVFFYPRVREYFKDDKLLPVFFNVAFLTACYESLFANTLFMLRRPADYLYVFVVVMCSYVFSYFYKTKRHVQLIVMVLLVCSYMPINVFLTYRTSGMANCVLYHFFFL